jgi:hypothetical protein
LYYTLGILSSVFFKKVLEFLFTQGDNYSKIVSLRSTAKRSLGRSVSKGALPNHPARYRVLTPLPAGIGEAGGNAGEFLPGFGVDKIIVKHHHNLTTSPV